MSEQSPYDFAPPEMSLPRKLAILVAATAVAWFAVIGFLVTAQAVVTSIFHVGSSRVDLQACKLEYSIVSPK